jgi:exodeoxyribonuclease VII large subunit
MPEKTITNVYTRVNAVVKTAIAKIFSNFELMETDTASQLIYSPSAVLNLFNNALNIAQRKKLIQLKGVFIQGRSTPYNGYYYDTLRDESADAQLTIIVPALIRGDLQANKTITVNGFITKRVMAGSGSIQVQITVTDLVEQTQNKYSADDLKKIGLLQAKAAAGFKDVHSFVKDKIINEQAFKIGVIIGKGGIIDNDIKHQLRESIGFYDLSFHRVSLGSETEIISAMEQLDAQGFDIIVVSRGGGEQMEVFDRISIAEKSIGLRALFVTAIGHKDDVSLLQQVADKAFITPTAFGQFLNEVYNQTVEEVEHSKARLVDSVRTQLAANYQKQIDNLNEQLKGVEALKTKSETDLGKIYEEKIRLYEQQKAGSEKLQDEKLAMLNEQLTIYKNKPAVNWVAVVIAVVVGLVIGYLIKHS